MREQWPGGPRVRRRRGCVVRPLRALPQRQEGATGTGARRHAHKATGRPPTGQAQRQPFKRDERGVPTVPCNQAAAVVRPRCLVAVTGHAAAQSRNSRPKMPPAFLIPPRQSEVRNRLHQRVSGTTNTEWAGKEGLRGHPQRFFFCFFSNRAGLNFYMGS